MAAGAGYARRNAALDGDVLGSSGMDTDRRGPSAAANSPEVSRQCADCSPSLSNRTFAATKMDGTEILESGRLLLAGGVAGAVSKTCTAPLARLTILYQACLYCWQTFLSLHAATMPKNMCKALLAYKS